MENSELLIDLMDVIKKHTKTESEDISFNVGTLNSPFGINGFKVAPIGTFVFEEKDRYFIALESLDGKTNVMVRFYKESLKDKIDFYKYE